MVDLVWCAYTQRRVWSVLIVPDDNELNFRGHLVAPEWDEDRTGECLFESSEKPVEDHDAAVLSDSASAWANAEPMTPVPEIVRFELPSTVGDNHVLGSSAVGEQVVS